MLQFGCLGGACTGSFPPCWVSNVSFLGLLSPSILPCHLYLQQSSAPLLTNITVLDVSPIPWQRQIPPSSMQAHSRAPPPVFQLSLEPHQQLYKTALWHGAPSTQDEMDGKKDSLWQRQQSSPEVGTGNQSGSCRFGVKAFFSRCVISFLNFDDTTMA